MTVMYGSAASVEVYWSLTRVKVNGSINLKRL